MDLIIVWFAVILVRNLFQDLLWLMRGEDPPSFRRQQERRRLRAANGGPITDRNEARKYWANAWHDAWESAGERRQHRHEQRRQDRRDQWARQDEERRPGDAEPTSPQGARPDTAPMDVAAPLTPVEPAPADSAPGPAPSGPAHEVGTAPADAAYRDVTGEVYRLDTPAERAQDAARRRTGRALKEHEARYQRYAMRRRNGGTPPTVQQLADELGIDPAAAGEQQERWDRRYRQELETAEADAQREREQLLWEWRQYAAAPQEDKDRLLAGIATDQDTPGGIPAEASVVGDPEAEHRFATAARRAAVAHHAGDHTAAERHQDAAQNAADDLGITTAQEMREVLDRQRQHDTRPPEHPTTSSEEAAKALLDQAELKREFARRYELAAAAEANGDQARADWQRTRAEEAAIKLGLTTEEEMNQVLAAYSSPPKTGSATRPSRSITTPAATAPSINEMENPMSASGETTGLSSAVTYTSDMARSASDGAASVETSIASLQSGEVSGAVLTHLATAQEHLTQAEAAFNAANAELVADTSVKEAYDARSGAGNKQFMQND